MSFRSCLAHVAVVLPLLVVAAPVLAQQRGVPTVALRAPVEYAEPFTNVASVREFRDGRVLVVDPREKRVELVDLARGTATAVGREGSGPGEWRMPGLALPYLGDSAILTDPLAGRVHVVAPNGTIARTTQAPPNPSRGNEVPVFPRAADALGRVYYLDEPFTGGTTTAATGTVRSVDLRTGAAGEHGTVGLAVRNVATSGSGDRMSISISNASALPAQDVWTVGRDGRVAIVRHAPYRVEWVAPNGQRVTGPEIAYTPVEVTEQDKEARRAAQRRGGQGVRMTFGGGSGGSAPAPPPAAARAEPDWPEVKPPFLANAAAVAPDGRLWVLRTRAAGDPIPSYDVFDSFGTLAARVTLPKDTRLVGFGERSVYLARTDADDLQWLQRYELP